MVPTRRPDHARHYELELVSTEASLAPIVELVIDYNVLNKYNYRTTDFVNILCDNLKLTERYRQWVGISGMDTRYWIPAYTFETIEKLADIERQHVKNRYQSVDAATEISLELYVRNIDPATVLQLLPTGVIPRAFEIHHASALHLLEVYESPEAIVLYSLPISNTLAAWISKSGKRKTAGDDRQRIIPKT